MALSNKFDLKGIQSYLVLFLKTVRYWKNFWLLVVFP